MIITEKTIKCLEVYYKQCIQVRIIMDKLEKLEKSKYPQTTIKLHDLKMQYYIAKAKELTACKNLKDSLLKDNHG